jgi:hypothetical protein
MSTKRPRNAVRGDRADSIADTLTARRIGQSVLSALEPQLGIAQPTTSAGARHEFKRGSIPSAYGRCPSGVA